MASNPMQRKSRNSFLLGVIITLLITGVVIAGLLLVLKQKNDQIKAEEAAKKTVYTLKQDVKAGQILTENLFTKKTIHQDSIPGDATSVKDVIHSWFLQTKEGEAIQTDKYGLYIDRSNNSEKAADNIVEVFTNNSAEFLDYNQNKVAKGDYFAVASGITEKVSSINNVQVDEYGMFLVNNQGTDKIVRVYQEEATQEFYIFELDTSTISTDGKKVRNKKYIDIKDVPVLARVNMKANTVMTQQLVVQSDEQVTDDTRQEQFNMITLPVDLMTGDYVDIRFRTPTGLDSIVVSKALVTIPQNGDKTYVNDTIMVNLREDEILSMSSAIVEAYGLNGAELYITKYVDPAMQEASLPTYTPNAVVTAQIQSNPNIVEIAKEELASRYSEAAKAARNEYLQQFIDNMDQEEYYENITDSTDGNIGTALTNRKTYLETLDYKK